MIGDEGGLVDPVDASYGCEALGEALESVELESCTESVRRTGNRGFPMGLSGDGNVPLLAKPVCVSTLR